MFIFLKNFFNAINSAFRACAERVHALIRSWFGPQNYEEIEVVASFKAAALKLKDKKEAVLHEILKKMEEFSIDQEEEKKESIVLNEPAMKALENDLAFIHSDRIQKRLSEAWMQEIVETVTTVNIESMGVLTLMAQLEEQVKEKDEEGLDGGSMDFLKKYLKDYIVEESTDLDDGLFTSSMRIM
uniref:AlNc14C21G2180 protein n=1 Tax=Albugo laibachii Nc14 TaxID=890382 RepID=F0W5L5_9STRA|nr:AlNc14C21G2180 [Albugo laibachii Nc14]|eukprot:CCA16406.1 AlNc14C21G2180 [Albugo laibachii Nc14]